MLHIHESCNIEPTKGGVEKLLQIYVLSLDMELVDIEPTEAEPVHAKVEPVELKPDVFESFDIEPV